MKTLKWTPVPLLILALFSQRAISSGLITATAQPTNDMAATGQQIVVPVIIDLSGLPEKLGSFTAALNWDNQILRYLHHSPGSAEGFNSPVVNAAKASEGKLIFAAANPRGAEGKVNVLNVTFEVIGSRGSRSAVKLNISAMAAALTFHDLLPYLAESVTGVEQGIRVGEIPKDFSIFQNHPNPFNPSTEITYQLPGNHRVRLEIFNSVGQKIRTLVNEQKAAGTYTVSWDGKDDSSKTVPAGIYLCSFEAGTFRESIKMMLVK